MGRGTSEHRKLHELRTEAVAVDQVQLETRTAADAVASQAGGLRHRRDGLMNQLHLACAAGQWRPTKLVKPSALDVSSRRRSIYRMRTEIAAQSDGAYECALRAMDFEVFRRIMQGLLTRYQELLRPGLWHRLRRGITRRLKRRP